MTALLEKLTHEALELPERERARLAHNLIVSMDSAKDAGYGAEWDTEIQRRVGEIQSGKVEGVPAEVVFARLRARHH